MLGGLLMAEKRFEVLMNEFDVDDENRRGECSYCKRCKEHEFLLDGRNCCIIHQRFERGVL